jgi:hypothetical protein
MSKDSDGRFTDDPCDDCTSLDKINWPEWIKNKKNVSD